VLTSVSEAVGTLTHDVADTLAPVESTVQPVLTSVSEAVGTLTHDVADTLAPVESTVQPVLTTHDAASTSAAAVSDTSTAQSDGPADTLLALATSLDTPIAAAGSPTATPASVPVQPSALTGDVIVVNDAPPPPADALFTGSQYTDYGVTLSSDIASPPQHAVPSTDTVSAEENLVPVVNDAQLQPAPGIVDTTHPIDSLGHPIL
jgi:hypothetical protein